GDRGLHVGGAATVQPAVPHHGGERIDRPGGAITRRHHIGVAGKAEMGVPVADAGVEVVHRFGTGGGERQAPAAEAQSLQTRLNQSERPGFGRGHALAPDQGPRE
ncbi:hypothetical protein RZS08_45170, partial [Arthrospira platensis SPKY1]|nr:hypothetical protein [Arthrospira platensis SPKY1]